jgi:ferric-dicitrate binding protein FerR (iron transport regulator)
METLERHERNLRQALEPAPEAVARVAARALLAAPRRTAGLRFLPAASLIALLAAAVLLVSPAPPRREPTASIEMVGELMVVRSKDGRPSIIGGGGAGGSGSSGTLIVIHGGGR